MYEWVHSSYEFTYWLRPDVAPHQSVDSIRSANLTNARWPTSLEIPLTLARTTPSNYIIYYIQSRTFVTTPKDHDSYNLSARSTAMPQPPTHQPVTSLHTDAACMSNFHYAVWSWTWSWTPRSRPGGRLLGPRPGSRRDTLQLSRHVEIEAASRFSCLGCMLVSKRQHLKPDYPFHAEGKPLSTTCLCLRTSMGS